MRPQLAEITFEVAGLRPRPTLRVGGETWPLGADITHRFGFGETTLSKTLLRVLIALALHRKASDGPIRSYELAEIVGRGASASSVAQVITRAVADDASRARRGQAAEPRLIQFLVRDTPGCGPRGGPSRGPYWLGVPQHKVHLDEVECRALLAGVNIREELPLGDDGETLLAEASRIACAGEFERGIEIAAHVFDDARRRGKGARGARVKELRRLSAEALEMKANLLMEMGHWTEGLKVVHLAQGMYSALKHPEGIAHCLQIEAHLWGQSGLPDGNETALWRAIRARSYLDNVSGNGRKGLQRAIFAGVVGQRQSKTNDFKSAEKTLLYAHRVCLDEGSPRWAAVWSARLAQTAMRAQRLVAAEAYLEDATKFAAELTVAGTALLVRARAEFSIETRQWSDAERLLAEARSLGEAHKMENQARRVRELEVRYRALRSR